MQPRAWVAAIVAVVSAMVSDEAVARTPSAEERASCRASCEKGGQLELLFGSDERHPPAVPLRLGPFFSALAYLGGGAQLATGLTALVWGASGEHDPSFARALSVSAGAVYDMPDGDDSFGGLARLSYGLTTTGRNPWKGFSGWLFVEGQWIADARGDRGAVIVGLRLAPLGFFYVLIPGVDP